MGKFLLGALLVFLYYNQTVIRRGYHLLVHKLNVIEGLDRKPPPQLKTRVDVSEPTLDQLEVLGFNVRRE